MSKIINYLFEGKELRKLFLDEAGEMIPIETEKSIMQIREIDLLTPDERADEEHKDNKAEPRFINLLNELKALDTDGTINPSHQLIFELTLNESAMSNPKVKETITKFLDQYKQNVEIKSDKNQGVSNES
jgi:hypothetical protein